MKLSDLSLSDSTRGFLKKNRISLETLLGARDDLTAIKGIGPSRATEIDHAIAEALVTADDEPLDAPEDVAAPEEAPPAPLVREAPGPKIPAVEPPDLVVYTDHSGNRMNARVAANLGGGLLNLQAFTRAGGSSRVEKVPYDAEGRRASWKEAVIP